MIWHGDLQCSHCNGHEPGYEEFNWLIVYLEMPSKLTEIADDKTEGGALLELNAMHGLGSSACPPGPRHFVDCRWSLEFQSLAITPPQVWAEHDAAWYQSRHSLGASSSSAQLLKCDDDNNAPLYRAQPSRLQTKHPPPLSNSVCA